MNVKTFYTYDNREFCAEVVSESEDETSVSLKHILVPVMTGQADQHGKPLVQFMPYSLTDPEVELEFDLEEFRQIKNANNHIESMYQNMFGQVQLASPNDMQNLKL